MEKATEELKKEIRSIEDLTLLSKIERYISELRFSSAQISPSCQGGAERRRVASR